MYSSLSPQTQKWIDLMTSYHEHCNHDGSSLKLVMVFSL